MAVVLVHITPSDTTARMMRLPLTRANAQQDQKVSGESIKMSTAHRIYLKRIDLVDRKLPLFCLVARSKLDTKFTVERNGIVFQCIFSITWGNLNRLPRCSKIHLLCTLNNEIG